MKKSFWGYLAAAMLCCFAAYGEDLIITGKSRYQIVLPDRFADRQTGVFLKRTAELIQTAFKETLGADFPVVSESDSKKELPAIYLSSTNAAEKAGILSDKVTGFRAVLAEKDGSIYIAGEDHENYLRQQHPVNLRNYILGTVKGATVFLEVYAGVRFLYPGKTGIDFEKRKEVRIPRNVKRIVGSDLKMSIGSFFDLFYNYATGIYGMNRTVLYGGHSYYTAVPKEKYGKTHPEYFMMTPGGKRDPASNGLCLTNPEVQQMMVDEVLKKFRRGADTVLLGQNDGFEICHCPKCTAYGNTDDPGEKLWLLHRDIAERAGKIQPDKTVLILSYFPNWNPPKSFKEFPANTGVLLCSTFPPMFPMLEKWKQYKVPRGYMLYTYNWGNYNAPGYTAQRTPRFCREHIDRFFRSGLNVNGIFRCAFRGENFGLEGPVYYILGKLLENPDADENLIFDDFCNRAFHEAAPFMKIFYREMYERIQLFSQTEALGAVMPGQYLPLTSGRSLLPAMFPPDLTETMERNLIRAEAIAKGKVKKRLELVRFQFEYTKNLVELLELYNVFRRHPDWALFERLAPLIERRNSMIDSMYGKNGHKKEFPGWPEIPVMGYLDSKALLKHNGRLSAGIGAPLTWNIDVMRKQHVLPGTCKKLTVTRLNGTPSTDPDSPVWKAFPWHFMEVNQFGPKKFDTKFKIGYDKEALWILVETVLPDHFKIVPLGRDAHAWDQDCIDLMVDPTGTRGIYYHFIWNSVQNSCYDAAFGLKRDPVDPGRGAYDPSWNGEWSYENSRKNGIWRSLVRIPFNTIQAKIPAAGDIWTLNIGREHFPTENWRQGGYYQMWSPNLESDTFMNQNASGEIIFQ